MIEIENFNKLDEENSNLKPSVIEKYKFFKAHQKLTTEEIRLFESEYNMSLPSEYITFLKKKNGGIPIQDCYGDGDYVINFFFSPIAPKKYSESSINALENFNEVNSSHNFLPIASAGGGDYVLLKITEPNYGATYYWDHNLENDEENPLYLEKSLTDFLSALHEDDE